MSEDKPIQDVRNVIRDTRKNVKYVIMASQKLDRNQKLKQIRLFNREPYNIRQKQDSTVTIMADEDNI